MRDKNFLLLITSTVNYRISKLKQKYFQDILKFIKNAHLEN